MHRILVLLSGGMDSATAVATYVKTGKQVSGISFEYGQRHSKELLAASAIAEHYGIPHQIIDLSGASIAFQGSALTSADIDVPDGHYEDETMKKTVVPNRNMVMLSIAVAYAISREIPYVAYAAHAGDHFIYPDCRPEFFMAMSEAIKTGNDPAPTLLAPFIDKSKADIAEIGFRLNVPYEKTWSCYKGDTHHCGTCGTCTERREAFKLGGVIDPTIYEQADIG